MKLIKRLTSVIFILVIMFVFAVANIKVNAAEKTITNKNKTTQWEIETEIIKNIGGMTQTEIYGKSKSTTAVSCQAWGNQHVNILEMKTDGVNSKLVTWGVQTGTRGLTLTSLTNIAKDYEKNHPGWIVLGGVNGDQYYFNHGNGKGVDGSWYIYPVPYYPLKIDGETRYPITPYNVSAECYLGVLNNGQANSFAQSSEVTSLMLEILDDQGNVTNSYKIDNVNKTPTGNEVSVWTGYPDTNVTDPNSSSTYIKVTANSTSNLYIVEVPELAYVVNLQATMDSSVRNCLFGRGVISKIDNTYTFGGNFNKKDEYDHVNSFGIETNNKEITDQLALNKRIRVQYHYASEELNECESFLNYHSAQIVNGTSILSDQSYDANRYNRSIWGRKADGTYVLVTGAKGNYAGLSQDETNTLLLEYGVVEAYQQDGGGSAMCIVRNMQTGEFILAQPSSDGNGKGQRSVAEACLFVVRDPGVEFLSKNITYHSATLTAKENFTTDIAISNMKITCNGQTYDYKDGLVIEGLDPDTTYDYTITYDSNSEKGSFEGSFTTTKMEYPRNVVKVSEVDINKVTFIIDDSVAKNIQLTMNGETLTYQSNENKTLVVKDLQREETYKYIYKYEVLNEFNNKTYIYNSEELEVTTTDFEVPEITKFEIEKEAENYVRVGYTYTDPDKVVTSANIICGNDIYELTNRNYSIKVEDLDLAHQEYQIQLVIEYKDKEIRSEILTVGTNYVEPTPSPKGGCAGTVVVSLISAMMLISIMYYKKH